MTQKIALVTGAARGIGQKIAERLEKSDWVVVRLDRAFSDDETASNCVTADVTDFKAIETTIADLESSVGPISAVINNAGLTRDGFFHKMDPVTQWDAVIAVNLTGPFNICRAIVPTMRQRGFGRIVNISSMNGIKGQAGQANYAASKAGLIAMTKTIALETASHGITANCIAPGFIDTVMTRAMRPDVREGELAKVPVGRAGKPEEIANLAAFLLSDEAAFITGETISINGGQLMT